MTSLSNTIFDELETSAKDFLKIDLTSNVKSENDAIERSDTSDVVDDMKTLTRLKKLMNVASILIAIAATYVVAQTEMSFLNHSSL